MKYLIEFSKEELQTIMNGLGELPAKYSMNVIAKIQQEVHKQDNEPAADKL